MSILGIFIIQKKKSFERGGKILQTNEYDRPARGKNRENYTPQSTKYCYITVVCHRILLSITLFDSIIRFF
jgi:hypothetical protein